MTADKREEYLHKDLTYEIRGSFFEVYNTLGPGFKEIIYHQALGKEFAIRKIPFKEKPKLRISYKGERVGTCEPDFVVDDKVLVETKAVPNMPKVYETQLFYYLRGTDYKLGFIVNFGGAKLDIRRRIYDKAREENQRQSASERNRR